MSVSRVRLPEGSKLMFLVVRLHNEGLGLYECGISPMRCQRRIHGRGKGARNLRFQRTVVNLAKAK